MPRLQVKWANAPQQSYMFKVEIPGFDEQGEYGMLYAKSITLPRIGVESIDVSNTNYRHSIAGKFKKEAITMQLYTYQGRTVMDLLQWFHLIHGKLGFFGSNAIFRNEIKTGFSRAPIITGYDTSDAVSGWYDEYVRNVKIYELSEKNQESGIYELINCYIENISFGDFNYESEDVVTIDLTLRYEHLKYTKKFIIPPIDSLFDVVNI